MANTKEILAQQIRQLRGDKSLRKFGVIIGKHHQAIDRFENPNKLNVSLNSLIELAESLGLYLKVEFCNQNDVDTPIVIRESIITKEEIESVSINGYEYIKKKGTTP